MRAAPWATLALLALILPAAASGVPGHLVVCADPNNLPFSNQAGQGFENRIAQLVARDLGDSISYVWWAQRRGYLRNTLNEAKCDLWPGVAAGVDRVATTRPYYRSTYVFVTRADRPLQGLTLDDSRLRSLTIGVQLIGNNAMNTPPAHSLARRGLIDNVRGFMLYGDYARPNPSAAIVSAVANGDVDVALVWGPLAGYFAQRSRSPLRLEPVTPALDDGQWPMTYAIAMGVRRDEPILQRRLQRILRREQPAIDALLRDYHVPRVPDPPQRPATTMRNAPTAATTAAVRTDRRALRWGIIESKE
ncbi:MAG TPA: quinoprotein dehydrogenase-associated putative ABC transporter substrate-binding protein [Steroidobacteraceae bacterium]